MFENSTCGNGSCMPNLLSIILLFLKESKVDRIKNDLRTFQFWSKEKFQSHQPQTKFTCSYKNKGCSRDLSM